MRISDWSSDVCSSDLHLGGRGGVERNARLLAQRLDALDGAVDMGTGLGMDGDDVGPRLGEGIEEIVDGADHQMHVERLVRMRPKRLQHRRADRQIGHEIERKNVASEKSVSVRGIRSVRRIILKKK